jgi:anti-sigma B factor antagonist
MRPVMAMTVTGPHGEHPSVAPEPVFKLVVTADGEGTLVVPHGELDLASTPELEAVLLAHTGRVVVDLRKVSFADASALHALLRAEERSRQNGMNLAFIAGETVNRLIEAVGLPDPLTLVAPLHR